MFSKTLAVLALTAAPALATVFVCSRKIFRRGCTQNVFCRSPTRLLRLHSTVVSPQASPGRMMALLLRFRTLAMPRCLSMSEMLSNRYAWPFCVWADCF